MHNSKLATHTKIMEHATHPAGIVNQLVILHRYDAVGQHLIPMDHQFYIKHVLCHYVTQIKAPLQAAVIKLNKNNKEWRIVR
jgi:hypothetical protein